MEDRASKVANRLSTIESHHSTLDLRSSTRLLVALAVTGGLVIATGLASIGRYREAAGAAALLVALGAIFVAGLSLEGLLVAWFALSPFASFYIRVPTDQSIITFNRAALILAVAVLLIRKQPEPRPLVISGFEAAWLALSLIALASALTQSADLGYGVKIAVDTFCLPLVLFHLVRHHFDVVGRGTGLLKAAIGLSFFFCVAGIYEAATATDLFQFKGSVLMREGERRVNGPFPADISFAVISTLLVLFLMACPRLFKITMDRTGRLLYWAAISAAVVASLLPKFRSVTVALLVGAAAVTLSDRIGRKWFSKHNEYRHSDGAPRTSSRAAWSLAGLALVLIASAAALAPSIFVNRFTDPRTAFGRLVTWKAALQITLDHPVFGVGLTNYSSYFNAKYTWEDDAVDEVSAMDAKAADTPHSNWLWISGEFGLVGLAFYAIAHLCLVVEGCRGVRAATTPTQKLAAAGLIAVFLAYSLPGLMLASGYYSDLNLYYFFFLGLLLNIYSGVRNHGIERPAPG